MPAPSGAGMSWPVGLSFCRLGRHRALAMALLLVACVHAGTEQNGANVPVARGSALLSPKEALAAMMQEVEERVLAARRAQERGKVCPPCATMEDAACCGECACVHGSCASDGACQCEADWFGDSCEVHVLQAGYFLPPLDPNERLPRRQAQAYAFSRPSARLVGEVDRLQHQHGCSEGATVGDPM